MTNVSPTPVNARVRATGLCSRMAGRREKVEPGKEEAMDAEEQNPDRVEETQGVVASREQRVLRERDRVDQREQADGCKQEHIPSMPADTARLPEFEAWNGEGDDQSGLLRKERKQKGNACRTETSARPEVEADQSEECQQELVHCGEPHDGLLRILCGQEEKPRQGRLRAAESETDQEEEQERRVDGMKSDGEEIESGRVESDQVLHQPEDSVAGQPKCLVRRSEGCQRPLPVIHPLEDDEVVGDESVVETGPVDKERQKERRPENDRHLSGGGAGTGRAEQIGRFFAGPMTH